MTIDPLESRVLLAADMNVRFEVDAPGPVSTLSVGENFTLKVFVQDARATPTGVLQAYYNLAYDTSVAAVTGPVTNGSDFQITASGDDSTAGVIRAAGGLSTTQVPPTPGNREQLLFSVPMKIVGAGQFNLTPSLATSVNPSDTVQLYGSSAEPLSAMNFTGLPLAVNSGPAVAFVNIADSTPTNATQVHYTVTFNEPVSGVNASDFNLAQSGITGSSIASVLPSSGFNTSYTVTVNAGSLTASTGTLGLNLIDGDAITDSANNTLAGQHTGTTIFTGQSYTIDRTAPTVNSIIAPGISPTNAASVQYTVTFSKSVTGVVASDFSVVANGITGASINSISGSGTTYTVTVNTGLGDGTLALNLVDGPAKISDAAGNTLAGGNSGGTILAGQSYTIRKTPPAATAITPSSANPTNAASVQFAVTFNEAVSGVSASDFKLVSPGITGASISSVTGAGTNWIVNVATGTGNGTLGLNLVDGAAKISDLAGNFIAGGNTGNVIFTGSSAYTIDKTPITVSSITLAEASPANRSSVDFTVTFNKSVSGVTQADFALAPTGLSGTSITGITGSGTTYTVTANTGTGNGTVGLNLINGSATISDAAGNTLAGANSGSLISTGPTYTIDKTPISISSIALAQPSPTNKSSVAFTVTFNKNVSGVTQADFSLAPVGLTGAAISNVTGSGATYTITTSTGTGSGTLGLNLINGAATISDGAGNTLAGGNTGATIVTGQAYTIDKTPVSVSSIALVQPALTNQASVSFTVTFNKSVSGLTQADFSLGTSGIAGAAITNVTGSGATYTVTANTGTGNGTLGLNLIDGPAKISDTAGNALAGDGSGAVIFSGPTYTIDKTPLSVSSIVLAQTSPTNAASRSFTVTFNKTVFGVTQADFALALSGVTGAAITGVTGNGATYTVTADTGSGNGSLGLNVIDGAAQVSDAAGNTFAGGNTKAVLSAGPAYTIDKTPVTVSSIALVESSPTRLATVDFAVTFNKSVTGLTQADFALDTLAVAGATITNLTGSGNTYTLTASTGSGSGTLGLNLVDGAAVIKDAAGNTLAGGSSGHVLSTGSVYTIDKTPPAVSSIVLADASPTRSASVDFTVTFNEPVNGVAASDFATSGSGITGANVTNVIGNGTTWTVAVNTGTGDGTLGLNLIDGAAPINDTAGNTLAGGGTSQIIFTGQSSYTVQKSPPAVTSIGLVGGSTTNAASVDFTVTFDRAVMEVASNDFSPVVGGSLTGAAVAGVTGSGTTWTVTVSTGTGDGTLGLNLIDGSSSIGDAAGNTLAGSNTQAVIFAGTTSYTIDKTPPAVSSIITSDATPTAAATVHFTVTFSESVTGVVADDFNLAQSGVIGAAITNVSGSGANWTVTATTGTGNGTLGLDLIAGTAPITDAAGNTLGGGDIGSTIFTGGAYTIDRTLPTIVSVVPAGTSPTNQASVAFTVTFSESVTGVDATDFSPVASGISGAQVTGVEGSGATYTVTLSTGTGSGTLGLNVVDGHPITDQTGKVLGGGNTGKLIFAGTSPYTIDKTPVSVSSIALAGNTPTNKASVEFTVTFNKSVSGVNAADFSLDASGLTGASITGVSGSGTTWTVTASTGTGSGTLGLNLIDGTSPIIDDAGNTLAGGGTQGLLFQGSAAYTIDKSAITVNSIALAEASPTNLASVDFTVTFNKSVTGVAAADFALVPNGITGATITHVSGSGTTWTVTASTGTGNGTLSLNLIDGSATISDAAGNALAGGGLNGVLFQGTSSYTIDKTPVSVSSIVPANANPTNQTSVGFNITFNKPVTGLTLADFSLNATGLSGATLSTLTGSGTAYTVTANTGNGSGTLGLTLVDGSAKIVDSAGNSLAGGGSGSPIFVEPTPLYTIDKTPIAVSAITPADSNPTNRSSVDFTVTFNKSVIGVTAGDFKLIATGIAGESITGITGSGTTWTVTASTGSGSGTLGLNFIDGPATITDAAGNILAGADTGTVLFAGTSSYTIDRVPLTVSSIDLAQPSPTNRTAVSFTVTFNKSVSGVTASDFDLIISGLSGPSVSSVTGSGTTYTVTANTGTGNGTIGLNFINGSATITDAAGNTLAGGGSGNVLFAGTAAYTIDKTPVSVTSVVPVESTTTNAGSLDFTVTFDKSVSGVKASDFSVATSGVTGAAVTNVSGSGTTYTVTVGTGAGNGTLGLNLIDGPSSISDAAGNTLAGGNTGTVIFSGTPLYTIDKTPLSVAMTLGTNPTRATSVDFTIVFNKSVSGVTAGDFALAATGLTGAVITNLAGSGTAYTVTANTGTGSGTLALNLVNGASKISDAAGNSLAGGNTATVLVAGPSYNVDKTPLAVTSIALVQSGTTNRASVEFTVTFNKSVTGVSAADFALAANGISGAAVTNVAGNGATWTVTAGTGTGNGTLGLNLIDGAATVSDAAGNALAGGGTNAVLFSSPTSYTIDKTPVAVNAIALVATTPTHLASVDFTITFNKSVTGVSAADFALAANGISGAAITNVTGNGATWTVTASTGSGNGTLGLNLVNGLAAISDAAGNTLAGGNTGAVLFTGTPAYTVDKTVPAVTSITRGDSSPTHAATVHFTVTFSESVTAVAAADFALAAGTGITGAAVTSVTGSGTTWTVTASTGTGDGTLGLNLIDGATAISDAAGNALAGGNTGAVLFNGTPVYTIDKTAPTVVSLAPAGSSPTNGATTQFTVTFSENVSGVNTSDFALTTGGSLTGASVTSVTGSGTNWTVRVNTGSGDGSITLKLIDGDAITDAAGNTLAGGHTGATIFTGQTAAGIQKTPPSVSSIALADANPVSAPATVHFTVTFSEAVTALNASDFALAAGGLTGLAITGVTGSGTTWTVTAATGVGTGTLGLKLIDGDAITDAAGNKLAGGHTGNTIFTSPTAYTVQTLSVQSISVVGLTVTVTKGTAVTNAQVATFTAVGGSQSAGDFTATIDWGDGTTSSGTVAAVANGFSVTGSHNYASPGERPVKITVQSGNVSQQGLTTATVGSATELFIAQVYRDLLKRDPEPQGLQFWTNLIDGGLNRQTAVAQVESSPEFRNAVVQGLYQLYLHRAAEPAVVTSLSNFLLTGTPEQIAAMLASSSEYFQVRGGGTNNGYLTALFNDALNRAPDASPLQATAPLDLTQQGNRTALAQAVFGSDEYLSDLISLPGGVKSSFHAQIPFGFFQAYLGRDADSAAMHSYLAELKTGQPDVEIIAQILASDEYFARATAQPG